MSKTGGDMIARSGEVVAFWRDEIGQDRWYAVDEGVDGAIRERFEPTWDAARRGELCHWADCAEGALAYILLTDQFPRNMYRGQERAFATDELSLIVAKVAIKNGWDMKISEPLRQFFYLPLMHSEFVADQERCIRMFMTRMPKTGQGNLVHARAHREVIRKFGRFPYRNKALGRSSTPLEADYIKSGGYMRTVEALQA